ncbi:MAG: thioesterase family protein [Bacteroidales bacterium]
MRNLLDKLFGDAAEPGASEDDLHRAALALLYEVARAEAMRRMGMTYKEMEERGVVMPIADMHIKYIRPAHYDNLLTIQTHVPELPRSRMHFDYEIFNENGKLINKGYTVLAFIKKETGRPCAAPEWFLNKLNEL